MMHFIKESKPKLTGNVVNSSDSKTKLTDLSTDCLLLILEHLNPFGLLAIAEVNDHLKSLAADVYRRNYAHSEHRITNILIKINSIYKRYDIYDRYGRIPIGDFEMMSKIYGSFGDVISNVAFYGSNKEAMNRDRHKIIDLLNDKSESLTDLTLSFVQSNTFWSDLWTQSYPLNHLDKPFSRVEKLTLRGHHEKFGSDYLTFNELFPNLRQLDLMTSGLIDQESLIVPFEYLENLHLHGGYEELLKKFIKKNPQITKLTIYTYSWHFLDFVNENLPNLTHLTYDPPYLDLHSENTIHFQNVIYFSTNDYDDASEITEKISFSKLENFELIGEYYDDFSIEKWIEFIGKNVELKNLSIFWDLDEPTLLSILTQEHPKLEQATFDLVIDVNPEFVYSIFKQHENLKSLKVKYSGIYVHMMKRVNLLESLVQEEGIFKFTKISTDR